MNPLARARDPRILGVCIAASVVCILSLTLMPRLASATAVSVSTITATSSNVYTNTGFATTSRVTTGDQVRYQLTLGGTPLIAPQINIFLMGSTTMSGSGTNWFYSTTSASVWTEGPITFQLGVGGTNGDATTTITQSNITNNVTYDKTAPTLNSVSWSDVDGSTQFSASDTFTFTFSETMATSTITAGNVGTMLGLSGSHTFGASPTVAWNTAGTVLTVTLGTSPTVSTGDTVDPTSAVKDSVGIADATAAPLSITDNVAPHAPTGLANTSFNTTTHGSISVSLASSGSTSIHYTTDGTTPTCSTGTVYSSAIAISTSLTLEAVGCDDAGNASTVASAVYTRVGGGGGSSAPFATTFLAVPGNGCALGNLFNTATGKPCGGSSAPAPTMGGGEMPSGSAPAMGAFSANLTVGSSGSEVQALQVFLNTHGYSVASSGPGSPGHETMTFGAKTRAALAAYQKAKGITPALGYFGPKTRAVVNARQ